MKIGRKKYWTWAEVAKTLANSGSDEQAEFFKEFLKECGDWAERQLCRINAELTVEERVGYKMLSYTGDEE